MCISAVRKDFSTVPSVHSKVFLYVLSKEGYKNLVGKGEREEFKGKFSASGFFFSVIFLSNFSIIIWKNILNIISLG